MGHRIPVVRSIRQRKKVCPGTITEHVKFKGPIRDWRSCSVIERLWRNSDSKLWHFCSLSTGKRASIFRKSRVIPVNWSVEKRPILFFCFFLYLQRPKKLDKSWEQHSLVAAKNKKSSWICRCLQLGYDYLFQSSGKRLKNATACWTPIQQSLIIIVKIISFHSK